MTAIPLEPVLTGSASPEHRGTAPRTSHPAGAHRGARAHPARADRLRRAAQVLRHPVRVLAARQHRHRLPAGHGGVVLWAARDQLTYSTFTLAIGFPMAVILPVIAILSVTAEWTQRSGLTTFTLVPHRGRIVFAKAIVAISIAVASMLVAFVIGALGNLLAAALAGRDAVWDQGVATLAAIVLGNTLVVLIGFMLGVLIRNSTAAIVAYFVYAFVAPPLLELLAANQAWFHDLYPWVDPNVTQNLLFHGPLVGQQWLQLAVTTAVWLVAPRPSASGRCGARKSSRCRAKRPSRYAAGRSSSPGPPRHRRDRPSERRQPRWARCMRRRRGRD